MESATYTEDLTGSISRELRRNVADHDVGGYDGDLPHSRARQREQDARVREGKLAANRELRALVVAKLELDWSPEQIAAWLLEAHPDRPELWVCHETIYQALYHGGRGGLSRKLTTRLLTGRPMRKRRRRPHERTPRFVAPAQLIEHRPPVVELRTRLGDWEGDLIIGRSSQSAIGTLVCRRTRYLKLVHLPAGHSAEALLAGIRLTMAHLPAVARKTLTWDQGSEMASHDQIASLFSEGVFFAHAGKPWQRGTNENTNGLARQYFPKGIDLRDFTSNDLLHAESRLNNRPRKTLDWQTPAAALAAALASP